MLLHFIFTWSKKCLTFSEKSLKFSHFLWDRVKIFVDAKQTFRMSELGFIDCLRRDEFEDIRPQ